ncbi:MAG: YqgE/AlgH family protein [Rhodobacteraceae bacterium]|nr:YqgE/AlgH family protein [Paracoccaceae bacterium]
MIRFDIPFNLKQFDTKHLEKLGANQPNSQYFAGCLLIAMPSMEDPYFKESVVLLLGHDDSKALGIVINKPTGYMQFGVPNEHGDAEIDHSTQLPVYSGGPVDGELAMIVHSHCRTEYDTTQVVNEYFSITSNIMILEDIYRGEGPAYNIFSLGYSSWEPGQLESEIQANAWLVSNSSLELVFKTSTDEKWSAAIRSLGVNLAHVSMTGGSA